MTNFRRDVRTVLPIERLRQRRRQQNVAIHALNVRASAERHREIELLPNDLEHFGDARLTHRAEAEVPRAADVGTLRAEGERLENILPRADAAVHVYLDARSHRGDDRGQRADAGLGAIELTSAVVADDERIGAAVDGAARVVRILDPLEDESPAPALLDPFDVVPA